jgi:hypothetical protein
MDISSIDYQSCCVIISGLLLFAKMKYSHTNNYERLRDSGV